MESRHDKILTDLSDKIIKTLNLFCLLPHLKGKKLVTDKEEEQLSNSVKTDKEKNTECLRILRAKGSRAFALFVEALKSEDQHLGHEDLVRILTEADEASETGITHLPPLSTTGGHFPRAIKFIPETDGTTAGRTFEAADHSPRDRLMSRMPSLQRPKRMMQGNESTLGNLSPVQNDSASARSSSITGSMGTSIVGHSAHVGAASAGQHGQLLPESANILIPAMLKEQLQQITNHITKEFRIFQGEVNQRIQSLEQKVESHINYCTPHMLRNWSADNALYMLSQPAITHSRPSTATSLSLSSHSSERGSFHENYEDNLESPRGYYASPRKRSSRPTLSSVSDQEESSNQTTANISYQKLKSSGLPQKLPLRKPKKPSTRLLESDSAIDYSHSPFEMEIASTCNLQLIPAVETSVPCVCKESQIPPVVFDFHVHFVFWEDSGQKTRIRTSINSVRESINVYNMHNGNIEKKKIIAMYSSQELVCGLVHFEDKITLLGGSKKQKQFNLQLFQLKETQESMTWQSLHMPRLSTKEIDPDNCICTEYNNGLIAASIQQLHAYASCVTQDSVRIHFHIYLPINRKWISAYLPFSQLRPPKNHAFKIQSCAANLRSLYYSVFESSQVHIYRLDLQLLLSSENHESSTNDIQPLPKSASTLIKSLSSHVKQCFISFLNITPITVAIKDNDDRSIMEVEPLSPASSVKIYYYHQFTSIVKMVMVRVVPKSKDSICIVFHDSKSNKCYLKTLNILSNM